METATLKTSKVQAGQAGVQPHTTRWYVLPALLVAVGAVNILMMPRYLSAGDPYSWREETRSILRNGTLAVDARTADTMNLHIQGACFDLNPRNGLWYSKFGIMNSLMALPPMLFEKWESGALPAQQPSVAITDYWGVLLSLVVCWLLWRLTGRYCQRPLTRILFVVSVFYGTYFWYYQRFQGGEIYQTLFFVAFFHLFVVYLDRLRQNDLRLPDHLRLLGAWLMLALLTYTRIFFGILIVPSAMTIAYVIWSLDPKERLSAVVHEGLYVILPFAAILAGLGFINYVKFGSALATGYDQWEPLMHRPTGPIRDGLWGMLFDAQYSIFLYFPPLALALLMYGEFWRRFRIDAVAILSCAVVYILVLAKVPTWRGEWTYGPRYLVFIAPVLSMPFLLLIDWIIDCIRDRWDARWIALVAAGALAYSGFLQFQVNRLDFYFLYKVIAPIHLSIDPDINRYFYDHNSAILYWDFIRHRDDLDAHFLFERMKDSGDPQSIQKYRQYVKNMLDHENLYWWSE